MGAITNISWCDRSWNPVIGCSKVSPGCAHCYAEELSKSPKMRLFGYTGLPWTPENAIQNVKLMPVRLTQPLHWRKPSLVFVNSMSDLFHELVPDFYIDRVFAVMMLTPQHIYQILTKRPERMQAYMTTPGRFVKVMEQVQALLDSKQAKRPERPYILPWPFPNVWLGVSVENQHWADVRIPILLDTPAAVRFLSCEPLLGELNLMHGIKLHSIRCPTYWAHRGETYWPPKALTPGCTCPNIDWVIVGGESGPKRRAMDLNWARSIRDQCVEAGVAFFYKQSGGPRSETGKLLDGMAWNQMPAVAEAVR